MDQDKIKEQYRAINDTTCKKIEEILENMDFNSCDNIGDFIAALFSVDRADMLSKDRTIKVVHARWMWWYAMYLMYHKSYSEIACITTFEGVERNSNSIVLSIKKLQSELKNNLDLRLKWAVIKTMVSSRQDEVINTKSNNKVRIYKPKHVEIEVTDEK